jgi:hypothetical protein
MSLRHGWMWDQGAREAPEGSEWEDWKDRANRSRNNRYWFNGVTRTRFPTKAEIRDAGPQSVLKGWIPPEPLISPGSRVLALGSCFAAYFIEWLATNGYKQAFSDSLLVLARNPFENAAVIAQQFRWAFGEVDPQNLFWVDKDKERSFATEEKRLAMRQALTEADVFIATLSLSEVWYDKLTGEPLWRVMPTDCHDPERHAFKVMSFAETVEALETIERIRARWLPRLRIIYTVSPQPMAATVRPVSAITANAASKAIVRGALDEFLRSRGDDLNRIYFYFPGYEIVSSLLSNPFLPDNRHLHDHVIELVLKLFADSYTSTGRESRGSAAPVWPDDVEQTLLVAGLEGQNAELQRICDQRLQVIEELKRVCDERLALIERLHASLTIGPNTPP